MHISLSIYRTLGKRGCFFFLIPVLLYFYLTSPRSRRSVKNVLSRVEKRGVLTAQAWKTYLEYADGILDRLEGWSGSFDDEHLFHTAPNICKDMFNGKEGGIILGSHLGNLELVRCLSKRYPQKKVYSLVHHKNAKKFNTLLAEYNPSYENNLIEVTSFCPETAVALADTIDRGDMIVIVGDRTSVLHENRSISVPFLGEDAPFPEGPFVMASVLKCPVYLLFCLKIEGEYQIFCEQFADVITLPRAHRHEVLTEYISRYAQRLEHHLLKAPHQWFNFYDFWKPAGRTP